MDFVSFFNAVPRFEIERSLRFDGSSYLSRTFNSSSLSTFSVWVKRGDVAGTNNIFGARQTSGSTYRQFFFEGGNPYGLGADNVPSQYAYTNNALRDPSAWYHIVYSTGSNDTRIWINGVEASYRLDTNGQGGSITNSPTAYLGSGYNNVNKFNGYMAEFHCIDGQQLGPEFFGEYNKHGVWIPKDPKKIQKSLQERRLDAYPATATPTDLSSGWSGTNVTNPQAAWDPDLATATTSSNTAGTISWSGNIPTSGTTRILCHSGGGSLSLSNGFTLNGVDITSKVSAAGGVGVTPVWVDVTTEAGSAITSYSQQTASGTNNPALFAMETGGRLIQQQQTAAVKYPTTGSPDPYKSGWNTVTNNPQKCFDGQSATACSVVSNGNTAVWSGSIPCPAGSTVIIRCGVGGGNGSQSYFYVNGTDISNRIGGGAGLHNVDISDIVAGTNLTSISMSAIQFVANPACAGITIDGDFVVDGEKYYGESGFYLPFDPDATNGIGHDHSGSGNHWTPTGFNTTEGNGSYAIDCSTVSNGGSFANAFNGNLGNAAGSDNYSGEVWTWAPSGGYAYSSSVEVYGGEAAYDQARINNDSYVAMNGGWKTIKTGSGTITKLDVRDSRGNAAAQIGAIRIDGTILIDNLFNSDSDIVKDTPTNNYCTWNPISNNGVTIGNGNLDTSSGSTGNCRGTMAVTSGKYYWEYSRIVTNTGTPFVMGLCESDGYSPTGHDNWTRGVYFYTDGSGNGEVRYYENGSRVTAATVTVPTSMRRFYARDVLQVAFDADSGKIWFGKNGDYLDSSGGTTGNPAAGTNATVTLQGMDIPITPMRDHAGVAISAKANFGQHDFVFNPPTGFKSLNTSNLPAPTVKDGSKYMNTVLYDGNASNNHAITGVGFQPDFVWIKDRNVNGHDHVLTDAVRGNTKVLRTNSNTGDYTQTDAITSFDSDGFTLGDDNSVGQAGNFNSANAHVAWNWLAGGSGSSNTDGNVTSTVSANPTAGFSIVAYQSSTTTKPLNVGHGLGVKPSFILTKNRDATASWGGYHSALGATKGIFINSTYQSITSTDYWNNTEPTSEVFTVFDSNNTHSYGTTNNFIAYCFAEVEGYSKFGSYTGNDSTDGVFVYTGFKPAWLLIKRYNTTGSWFLMDSTRSTYNATNDFLYPNTADDEDNGNYSEAVDILSNGFKCRTTSGYINGPSDTYIYMAFAENPFGGEGVAPATAR